MAKKDLIIGAFKGYNFIQVAPWVQSLNDCGFKGDKVIISINSSKETNQKLIDSGMIVLPSNTPNGMMFHMERFLHIYDYLRTHGDNYRYVLTTDVRDVIFQTNPMKDIEQRLENSKLNYIAVSESIHIENEPWNKDNIIKCFSDYTYNTIKKSEVYNVGTLAGTSAEIRDLCAMLFHTSSNRADWVADQAAYNVMMNLEPYRSKTYFSDLDDAFSCNLHVTNKPDQMEQFGPFLTCVRPEMNKDSIIVSGKTKIPYSIVHQYDRVPDWKKVILKNLNIEDESEFFTYKV
jgi:hypothetical protein